MYLKPKMAMIPRVPIECYYDYTINNGGFESDNLFTVYINVNVEGKEDRCPYNITYNKEKDRVLIDSLCGDNTNRLIYLDADNLSIRTVLYELFNIEGLNPEMEPRITEFTESTILSLFPESNEFATKIIDGKLNNTGGLIADIDGILDKKLKDFGHNVMFDLFLSNPYLD